MIRSLACEGGRVELSLCKHGSHSSLLTRTIGDLSLPPQTPCAQFSEGALHEILPLEAESSADTARPHSMQRPSHVPLPRQRSFSLDENALPTTDSRAPSANSRNDIARRMNVLVVDDDAWTRLLMTRMLTRLGCKVSTAENGELALEMIVGTAGHTPSSETPSSSGSILDSAATSPTGGVRYSVIFLDNQMPVLSGLKAVARLREMGRRDFIVGVTGNALLTDQEEYLAAGADRFVIDILLRDISLNCKLKGPNKACSRA